MVLKLKVKAKSTTSFTACQLTEIAESMCVVLPDKMRLVYYGQTAPLDTSLTWQPTNGAEDPVGKVKTFKDGTWT